MTDSQTHAKPSLDLRRIHLVIHLDEGRIPQNTSVLGPDARIAEKQDPWDLPVFYKDSATMELREYLRAMTTRLARRTFISKKDGKSKSKWKYNSKRKSYVLTNIDDYSNKTRGPVRSVSVRPVAKCHLLDKKQLHKLRSWVPKRFSLRRPETLFWTTTDAYHLQTLYHNCRNYSQFAIIIRTDKKETFGAFIKCINSFEESRKACRGYFGTGETFVFSFTPVPVRYRWVGLTEQDTTPSQNMFISANNNSLIIGGGNGYAIQLDSDLERGYTGMCDTFYNPLLCKDAHFRCLELEVLGFTT